MQEQRAHTNKSDKYKSDVLVLVLEEVEDSVMRCESGEVSVFGVDFGCSYLDSEADGFILSMFLVTSIRNSLVGAIVRVERKRSA